MVGLGCDVTDLLAAGLDGTLLRMIVSHFVMVIDPVETRRSGGARSSFMSSN